MLFGITQKKSKTYQTCIFYVWFDQFLLDSHKNFFVFKRKSFAPVFLDVGFSVMFFFQYKVIRVKSFNLNSFCRKNKIYYLCAISYSVVLVYSSETYFALKFWPLLSIFNTYFPCFHHYIMICSALISLWLSMSSHVYFNSAI